MELALITEKLVQMGNFSFTIRLYFNCMSNLEMKNYDDNADPIDN